MDMVDVTLEELSKYENVRVRLTALVCHHLFWTDAMCISCGPDGSHVVLILLFRSDDDRWREPASALCRGKTVRVTGRVLRLTHGTATLGDCELAGEP